MLSLRVALRRFLIYEQTDRVQVLRLYLLSVRLALQFFCNLRDCLVQARVRVRVCSLKRARRDAPITNVPANHISESLGRES